MTCLLNILLVCLLVLIKTVAAFTNGSEKHIHCKAHISSRNRDVEYDKFYEVTDKYRTNDTLFTLHYAIRGGRDGIILLTDEARNPSWSKEVYEIVVGGDTNTKTFLRRWREGKVIANAESWGILSPDEYRFFYIKMYPSGYLEVGKRGDPLEPVLGYHDPNPLPVKFFSFASFQHNEVNFLYDCPSPPETITTTTLDPHTLFMQGMAGIFKKLYNVRSSNRSKVVFPPTYENVRDGFVVMVEGYSFGTMIISLAANVQASQSLKHLSLLHAPFYTTAYRWGMRHLLLWPNYVRGTSSYTDTHKVWSRRYYFMDEFIPAWMRVLIPWVSKKEWEQEQNEYKRYVRYAEPAFGKHYRYPKIEFHDFASEIITGESIDEMYTKENQPY